MTQAQRRIPIQYSSISGVGWSGGQRHSCHCASTNRRDARDIRFNYDGHTGDLKFVIKSDVLTHAFPGERILVYVFIHGFDICIYLFLDGAVF